MRKLTKNTCGTPTIVSFEDFLCEQGSDSHIQNKKRKQESVKSATGSTYKRSEKNESHLTSLCTTTPEDYDDLTISQKNSTTENNIICIDEDIDVNYLSTKNQQLKNKNGDKKKLAVKRKRSSSNDLIMTVIKPPSTNVGSSKSALTKKPSQKGHDKPVFDYSEDVNEFLKQDLLWTQKFQPIEISEMLENEVSLKQLHAWLKVWKTKVEKERILEAALKTNDSICKRVTDDDEDFLPSDGWQSWDDDVDISLCNTSVIIGPTGCGKTAAVYACAKQIGFKVLELNASTLRSSKCVLSQLQEATQSYLVANSASGNVRNAACDSFKSGEKGAKHHSVMQRSSEVANFFLPKSTSKVSSKIHKRNSTSLKSNKVSLPNQRSHGKLSQVKKSGHSDHSDQISLILFDEVEAIMEIDKNFWSAVCSLMNSSKRPIILTTTAQMTFTKLEGQYEKVVFNVPSVERLSSHLKAIACKENNVLEKFDCEGVACNGNGDIRQSILNLQFWANCTPDKLVAEYAVGDKHKTSQTSRSVKKLSGVSNKQKKSDTLLSSFFLKVVGIYDILSNVSNFPTLSMKFPAILYGLNDLLSEVLMHVEAAVSHLHFHHLPPLLLLNRVELLSLPTRQDTSKTLKIHFHSPIPSHSWNESSDTDDDVNLISLSGRRKRSFRGIFTHTPEKYWKESDDEEERFANSETKTNTVVPKSVPKSQRMEELHCLQVLSQYFQGISDCDQLRHSYSLTFECNSDNKHCVFQNGHLDQNGFAKEASFSSQATFNDLQASLQIGGLRKAQNGLVNMSTKSATKFKFSNRKIPSRLHSKLFSHWGKCAGTGATSISCSVYHMDYLPALRSICRSEDCRKVNKPQRRFFHYLENICTTPGLVNRLSKEFEIVVSEQDALKNQTA